MIRPLDLRNFDVLELVYGEDIPSPDRIAKDRVLVETAIIYAKVNEYDGVIHPDSDVYNHVTTSPSYVIFDASQVIFARPAGDEHQWNLYGHTVRDMYANVADDPNCDDASTLEF